VLPSAGFEVTDPAAGILMNTPTTPRFPLFVLSVLLFFVPLVHAGDLSDPFALPKSTLLLAGATALLADAALRALRGDTAARPARLPALLAGLFLLAAGAAAALSPNRGLACRGLADLAALAVIAWGASGVARDPARAAWLFRSALASAALVAAGTLAQVFVPGYHLALAGLSLLPPSPAGATLGDPGLAAQLLVVGLPFGIAAVAAARGTRRLAAGAALGLVAAALVFIGRPEGWLAAILVAAVALLTRVARAFRTGGGWSDLTPSPGGSAVRTAVMVVLVVFLVTALGRLPLLPAPAAPLARVGLLAPTTGDPSADRAAATRGSAALLGLHPLGVGPGFWRHAFMEVAWTRVPASPFTLNHQAIHAGNSLLELAAETGIAGGLLFVALFIAALVATARMAFARDPDRGDIAKAALDTLLAAAIVAMLGSVFQEGAPALITFVAIGLACPARPSPGGGARRRAAGVVGLVAVLALAMAAAGMLAARYQAARWTFIGQALLTAGDAGATMRALDRPVAAASPEHLPHAILGNAAQRAGLHDRAAAHFGAVLERSPWFIAAFLGRAAAWTDLGRYDKADADLHAALAVWPDNPGTMLALGRLSARRGRFDQALTELRRATELDPSQADPWIAIGEVKSRLERQDEAIEAFRMAAERNPRHPRVNILIGNAFEKKGLLEMAVGFLQKATSIDPTGIEPRIRLANVFNALGRACEARDALAAARELESDQVRRDTLDGLIDRLDLQCRDERAGARH
jgi:tetratricopeptide (TPR) repeat protein